MLRLPFDFLNTESTPVTDDTIQLHSQQHISGPKMGVHVSIYGSLKNN